MSSPKPASVCLHWTCASVCLSSADLRYLSPLSSWWRLHAIVTTRYDPFSHVRFTERHRFVKPHLKDSLNTQMPTNLVFAHQCMPAAFKLSLMRHSVFPPSGQLVDAILLVNAIILCRSGVLLGSGGGDYGTPNPGAWLGSVLSCCSS